MIGKIKAFILCIGAFAAADVMAAKPLAVWDGDFSQLSQNGVVTIDPMGNSISDNNTSITINKDVGISIEKNEGTFSGGYTVLFKYSDLNWALAGKQVLATTTLSTDGQDARVGVTINEQGKTCGIWNRASWNTSGSYNVITNAHTAGVLAYSHYSTANSSGGYGTKLHYLRNGGCAEIMVATTLGAANDSSLYKGVTLGGMKISREGFSSASGMKICGIAVFEGVLSEEEMAAYVWPTMKESKYRDWDYAGLRFLTAMDGFQDFASPKYLAFDRNSGIEGPAYDANDPIVKWQSFAFSNAASFDTNVYQAPGNVLRLIEQNQACTASFSPLTLGGMIVESTATGCSLAASGGGGNRNTLFGDPTARNETWFCFDTSFSVERMGQSMLIGTVNIVANNEASVKLSGTSVLLSGASGKQPGGNPVRTAGGVLKMHGTGSITAGGSLDASSATLDFSDIADRAVPAEGKAPFIDCPLVLASDTRLVFPDGISLPYSYRVARSISGTAPNFCLYANGELIVGDISIDADNGIVTIAPSAVKVLNGSDFDEVANWEGGLSVDEGDSVIVKAESDVEINVSGSYNLDTITILGAGTVSFAGTGSISASNIKVVKGAKFVKHHDSVISGVSAINLEVGSVLRLVGPEVGSVEEVYSEGASISGGGAVETYGRVDLANGNEMTGGITVKSGSSLSTSYVYAGGNEGNTGYGPYRNNVACANQSRVVVENGGCVDVNNIVNSDCGVALVIAGNGILQADGTYSGAVRYSGSTKIGTNKRQISYIELSSDAEIDCGAGWGLVHNGHGNARLAFNGHTLVVHGSSNATFVAVNVNSGAQSTGTLVIDGPGVEFSQVSSNLGGIDVVVKGSSPANFSIAPSGMKSLTFKPSNRGIVVSNLQLSQGYVFRVDSSGVNPSGLSLGAELTLLTVPTSVELSTANIEIALGARYESVLEGNLVKARVVPLENFMHYDFDKGASDQDGAASDSQNKMAYDGESGDIELINGRDGKAVHVHAGYTPYWDSYTSGISPFRCGEVSVTTLAKIKETGVVLWGFGNKKNTPCMGLIAINEKNIGVVVRSGSQIETILQVEAKESLTAGWHFIAVVANSNGTTLYVDDQSAYTAKTIPFSIGQHGQLGSFYSGAIGANKVGENGYYLDDWRIYNVALMPSEIRALRGELNPKPFVIRIR